jgi:homoserine kinase type II
MSEYTVLNQQDIDAILGRYTSSPVTSFETLRGGLENTNYLVKTTENTYVLTISQNKSTEHALILAQLLNDLNRCGIRTSKIVKTQEDALVTTWHDKPIILKEYVDGMVTKDLNANLLELTGEEMGRLHKIDPPDYVPNVLTFEIGLFLTVGQYESDKELQTWFTGKHDYISEYLTDGLPKALIHSDLFWNNVLVNASGVNTAQQITLLDFEDACYYYRIFDVGMAIVGLCSIDGVIDLHKAKAFLAGYQKQIKLNDAERAALKPFVVTAASAIACWRQWQFNYMYPTPSKMSLYVEMQDLADKTQDLPDSIFLDLL